MNILLNFYVINNFFGNLYFQLLNNIKIFSYNVTNCIKKIKISSNYFINIG